ncbi:MAG: CinA family protein [bacterium]
MINNLDKLAGLLGQRLGRRRLAVAESCTGGLLGSAITGSPGSSGYFVGGVICYADEVKTGLLGVPQSLLEKWGAVSPQVAEAMASGARKLLEADIAVAVSGIAGPGGGSLEKPVGLVYISVASGAKTITRKFNFPGSRSQVKEQSAIEALNVLLEILNYGI